MGDMLYPDMVKGGRADWQTPREILDRISLHMGEIAFDPCTVEGNPTGATEFVCPPRDGLQTKWPRDGLVYVNPPYGRELKLWASKIADEAFEGAEVVALTPSRSDTVWWHELWDTRDCCCFVRGRLTFVGAPNPAPFPSCVWYFGRRPNAFVRAFHGLGVIA